MMSTAAGGVANKMARFIWMVVVAWNIFGVSVTGSMAPFGKYPSFAISNSSICGATLIAPDVLLTAAGCLIFTGDTMYIGGTTRDPFNAPETRTVRGTVRHPYRTGTTDKGDIMLIFLDTPSNSTVSPYNTNASAIPVKNQYVTVIGHGKQLSKELRESRASTYFDGIEQYGIEQCRYIVGYPASTLGNQSGTCIDGVTSIASYGGPAFDDATGMVVAISTYTSRFFTLVGYHSTWIQSTICALSKVTPSNINCVTILPPFGPPVFDPPKRIDAEPVSFDKYPYFVTTRSSTVGALIWPDVLLSSETIISGMTVYFGGTQYGPTLARENRTVRGFVQHPLYSSKDKVNALSLAFLDTPTTAKVSPYNIISRIPRIGDNAIVLEIGPGQYFEAQGVLLERRVPIENYKSCSSSFATDVQQICIGNHPEFTCQTYIKGSQLFDETSGTLIGFFNIPYFNYPCSKPHFYTRVSLHVAWIQSAICAFSQIKPTDIDCSAVVSPYGPPVIFPPIDPPVDPPQNACANAEIWHDNHCSGNDNRIRRRFLFFSCKESCVSDSEFRRRFFWGWRCGTC